MKRYNPSEIEPKWQKNWEDQQVYKANLASSKPKYIAMSMFNYPSGAGIHIGHAMNYTISDVMARYKRQQGFESYHPVGWDSFGLPAENYAIKTGVSPQKSMATIIPSYHKQYKAMGWSNDWSREIATHEPAYYKWTQWIFAQMYKHGLAYQDARLQWWCNKCQTVLANEQVIDGKCWRHEAPDDPMVEKKEVKQWFFKVTEYADELLEATDALDWSPAVKTAQKNWIGKSKGAEIDFKIDGNDSKVTVFTTRPDTLFGATFLVLAPEHDLVNQVTTAQQKAAVEAYVQEATKKSDLERQASKEKTGVFTGAYAVNPANNEKIPIWIADYVLSGYGTGAIMAVPAHDERDHEFAQKYNLPITQVVAPLYFDDAHPLKDDKEIIRRKTVHVLVKHPQQQKLLMLYWTIQKGDTFIVGGVEDGEDVVEAARREVLEETGYKNLRFVRQLGGEVHSQYYAMHKDINRYAEAQGIVFELENEERVEVSTSEQTIHEPKWVGYDDILANPVGNEVAIFFDRFINGESAYGGEGVLINSGDYSAMSSSDARERIVADLAQNGVATEKTTFKIRDWSVSRQRYWGAPIPIVNCQKCGPVLVPDDQLPVVLPELADFAPSGDGRSALARATDWLTTECPQCGGMAERETDTLDTYIDSSWYMLRYFDTDNQKHIFDSAVVNKWTPIDFYNGADHATAHMIYARFITRFFNKIGLVDNPEPFKRFLFNGKVTASDGQMFSKSKGNGIDPLEIISSGYGADALRTYLMFAAPLDLWARWDPQGVPGTFRFLSRIWNIVQEYLEAEPTTTGHTSGQALRSIIHPAIKKVTQDIDDQKYNTAIATMMKATNDLYALKAKHGFDNKDDWHFAVECLVMLVAPFAPHIADELWHQLGHDDSVTVDHWPQWDEAYLQSDTVTVAVQVNGKLRGEVMVAADASEDQVVNAAVGLENVQQYSNGKQLSRVIYVPGRLVNIVIK